MRLGCSGCLWTLVLIAVAAAAAGGAIGTGTRILASPDVTTAPQNSAADGARAQQKLFSLARRPRSAAPVVLTEAEVNALLSRHLVQARGVALGGLAVWLLGDDRIELMARTPARQVLDDLGVPMPAWLLPARWRERPVWLGVVARVQVESARRQVRLEAERFTMGRQRLPTGLLRLVLDPATLGLLRWPLPDHVEQVEIEPGRVVIRTAS